MTGIDPAPSSAAGGPPARNPRVVTVTGPVSRGEARRLEAIGGACAATGAAVLVHAEIGTAGHEIVDRLKAPGASPDRIALAHRLVRRLDAVLR